MPESLRDIIRKKIIKNVLNRVGNRSSGWKILVVDRRSHPLLNSVLNALDLGDHHILSVEYVDRDRAAHKNYQAIYFIYPTTESVKSILIDLNEKKLYSKAHVFTIGPIPDHVMDLFRRFHTTGDNKVSTLIELDIDFFALESSVYHFQDDEYVNLMNLIDPQDPEQLNVEIEQAALQLAGFVSTLGETEPTVRYFDPTNSRSTLSARIAHQLQCKLDHRRMNESPLSPSPAAAPNREKVPPAEVIILDRGIDLVTPLMHDLTFQALVNDVLGEEEPNKVTYGSDEVKTVTLEDKDSVWASIRHKFIEDAVAEYQKLLSKFAEENPVAAAELKGAVGGQNLEQTLEKMKEILYSSTDAQEKKAQFALHVSLLMEVKQIIADRELNKLAVFEQNLICGVDSDDMPVDTNAELPQILANPKFSLMDRLRILALYSVVRGQPLSPDDVRRMLEDQDLADEDLVVFRGLNAFSVGGRSLRWDREGRYSYLTRKRERKSKSKPEESEQSSWEAHRYIPVLRYILEDLAAGKLDPNMFPLVTEPATDRTDHIAEDAKIRRGTGVVAQFKGDFIPKWGSRRRKAASGAVGSADYRRNGRYIVFFVGGLTYSEVRVTYEAQELLRKEIYIGSQALLNPLTFVDILQQCANTESQRIPLPPLPKYTPPSPDPTVVLGAPPRNQSRPSENKPSQSPAIQIPARGESQSPAVQIPARGESRIYLEQGAAKTPNDNSAPYKQRNTSTPSMNSTESCSPPPLRTSQQSSAGSLGLTNVEGGRPGGVRPARSSQNLNGEAVGITPPKPPLRRPGSEVISGDIFSASGDGMSSFSRSESSNSVDKPPAVPTKASRASFAQFGTPPSPAMAKLASQGPESAVYTPTTPDVDKSYGLSPRVQSAAPQSPRVNYESIPTPTTNTSTPTASSPALMTAEELQRAKGLANDYMRKSRVDVGVVGGAVVPTPVPASGGATSYQTTYIAPQFNTPYGSSPPAPSPRPQQAIPATFVPPHPSRPNPGAQLPVPQMPPPRASSPAPLQAPWHASPSNQAFAYPSPSPAPTPTPIRAPWHNQPVYGSSPTGYGASPTGYGGQPALTPPVGPQRVPSPQPGGYSVPYYNQAPPAIRPYPGVQYNQPVVQSYNQSPQGGAVPGGIPYALKPVAPPGSMPHQQAQQSPYGAPPGQGGYSANYGGR
ncbi:Sec1-like protein [Cladochytrium replicatum]|nr:Sec1-like protein [Cladochytrium replicatum]